jgi:nicotinamide-nucleotide amidase
MSDTVVLISTGEELLTGETVDTNSAWLAASLWEHGIGVRRMVTAGDDLEGLVWAITTAAASGASVICTGGLGPTEDDRTAEAVAGWAGCERVEHAEALSQIVARYQARGQGVSAANRKQAFLPKGATVLENRWGSAPAFSVAHEGTRIFCLPGVPVEMRRIFEAHVLSELKVGQGPITHRVRTFGVAESRLQTMLGTLDLGGAELGFRAHIPEVQIKLRFEADVSSTSREAVLSSVTDMLGQAVFSVDGGDLAETAVARLSAAGQTLALAESCTAGMLSSWIGDVPGASSVLMEGIVVYENAAKTRAAGVEQALLISHGAVSEPVARGLAEGIQARSGTTWGIGITGIAGPGGGTEDKPRGTVHIAVAGPMGTVHRHAIIPGTRAQVRKRAAGAALALLLHSC